MRRAAGWINLLVPGAGLVLLGHVAAGLILGLIFTSLANFLLAAILLFPDDVSELWRAAAGGGLVLVYVLAQLGQAQVLRAGAVGVAEQRRREALQSAKERLERGEAQWALQALSPLRETAAGDLLLAVRWAQALSAAGQIEEALAAWEVVRKLDRHHIYRRERVAHESQLRERMARPAASREELRGRA